MKKEDYDTIMYILDMCASLSIDKIQMIIDNLETMIENKKEEDNVEF